MTVDAPQDAVAVQGTCGVTFVLNHTPVDNTLLVLAARSHQRQLDRVEIVNDPIGLCG